MRSLLWMVALCAVTASVTGIENKQPVSQKTIKELGEEIRDRRNLEYSLNLPHSRVASFRSLERRISNSPPAYVEPSRNFGALYQGRPSYGPVVSKTRQTLPAPAYAVQMEPMVQYSQKDPLYDGNADHLEEVINRNEIQAQPKILSIGNSGDQLAENDYQENEYALAHGNQFASHGPPYGPVQIPYYEHPEPIIEIIIRESNESLPAPPVQPILRPKKKDPIQVFYVKYEKNPHGDGKDVIYDTPIPAITPASNIESDYHDEYSTIAPSESLTYSPPPSTTLRAIIKPDSEDYHSDSGIRISFGSEGKEHRYHEQSLDGSEETAPQIAVALPQQQPPKQNKIAPQFQQRQQLPLREQQQFQTNRFQQNSQQAQQRIQFQQQQPFPQTYQQLPLVNTPNQPFRAPQNQFGNRPTSPVFSNPPTLAQNPPQHVHRGPPQGPPRSPLQGPPFGPSQGAGNRQHPPNFSPQGVQFNNPRPPPQFQQRPDFSPSGPTSQRGPFPPGPQRPIHHGPPQQQYVFNEHEYLQKNYHTITTEQLEPQQTQQQLPREQQLPVKAPQNFRESSRKPILPPIPISQEEYNQRYYEQVRLLQHQEQRNRPRPPQNLAPQPPHSVKYQQLPIQSQNKPVTVQINQSQPPQNSFSQEQSLNVKVNIQQQQQQQQQHQQQQQQIQQQQHQHQQQQLQKQQQQKQQQEQQFHQQNLRPQPPLLQQPPQFQQDVIGSQFVPPGGELISSIPKYEQHLLINPNGQPSQIQYQNTQQSQSQSQPQVQIQKPSQHSVLTQQLTQQSIQQQYSVDNNQQSSGSAELISAYEQNQQEIYKLQEKLRKSEEGQHNLLSFNNPPPKDASQSVQNSGQQVNIYNEQYYTLKNQNKAPEQNKNLAIDIQERTPQIQTQYVSYNTNKPPVFQSSTFLPKAPSTSRFVSSTPNSIVTEPPKVEKKEKSTKPIDFELPDEVPDELRQQLLSSGILENAQISILDYDKVGDIPLESLPPDQLANFYGAGGGLQVAGSERVSAVVKKTGEKVTKSVDKDLDVEGASSERFESYADVNGKSKDVEMKVVHFDPNTIKGQQVAGEYVQDDAKRVDPVALNDQKYNRYLPLKVNGAHFPLPDVPELKGRKVTSVVVLAPVDYDFAKADKDVGRSERAAPNKGKGINFVTGDALKRLVKTPTVENYKKWLEKEKNTTPALQSVVLLVTGTEDGDEKNREIFMYDVVTQTVSKLDGALSSSFVDVAETNAHSKDFDQLAVADAGVVESSIKLVPAPEAPVKPTQKPTQKETKHNNHKAIFADVDVKKQTAEKKEQKVKTESVEQNTEVKRISDSSISRENGEQKGNQVLISSGYSRMKLGRNLRRED